ncbi:hypothetical protein CHS0354_006546 [Potamilus streckersoni]|uniref:Uncharacterized protein n=1 Tax=Potamilus streckersoni TaxID=2493646 RepID=A0AAE0WAZ7_9BIVA|nr:hypothetical protein CHS0354_006546 [Potamilus streckersoni]
MCIRLLLLLLHFTHCQEIAELGGDLTVAGMFQIYRSTTGKCGEVVTSSVMALEATKWVFKKLNQTGYFPINVVVGDDNADVLYFRRFTDLKSLKRYPASELFI